jgi:hypothetical protein
MIKKVKEGYKVISEKSGKNLGGPYKTKGHAKERLRQVEFFKRKKLRRLDAKSEISRCVPSEPSLRRLCLSPCGRAPLMTTPSGA